MRVYAHDLEKSQAHIFKHAVKSFWKLTISPQKQLNCYTRRDEVVGYLLSPDRMEAIIETMEILANPKAMRAIRDYEKGRTKFFSLVALET